MARIRTIKPEFWTSAQVVECSPIARLLFIGIWNFADDAGNIPASTKTLKMLVFPGDDFTVEQIGKYVQELISEQLLVEYEGSDGKKYWHVTGWHHQKIEKPSVRHPKFADHSPTIRRPFAEASPTEKDDDKERILSSSSSRENFENSDLVEADEFVAPPVAPPPPPSPMVEQFASRIRGDDGEIADLCRRAKVPDKPVLLDYLQTFTSFRAFSGQSPPDFNGFRVNFLNWIPTERRKRQQAERQQKPNNSAKPQKIIPITPAEPGKTRHGWNLPPR